MSVPEINIRLEEITSKYPLDWAQKMVLQAELSALIGLVRLDEQRQVKATFENVLRLEGVT